MYRLFLVFKVGVFAVLLSVVSNVSIVSAEDDLGLCPTGFNQRLVTTGFVDCYRESSNFNDREDAELARVQREAACNSAPNAQITDSQIRVTSSGQFFAQLVCTVTRAVPPGTVLCPADSEEVVRAFDTVVCRYFGSAETTMQAGQEVIEAQATECVSAFSGRVLKSRVSAEIFNNNGEDTPFFMTSVACAKEIPPTDIIQCPYSFDEITGQSDENMLTCETEQESFATLAEAQEANQELQEICTGTTAGLGTVSEFVAAASDDVFISRVTCEVRIARYGDFTDQSIIRACDASCTEEVAQVRECINGGQVGSTGCTEAATQVIVRRCNTGTASDSLCPLILVPSTVLPLLLDEEEPE